MFILPCNDFFLLRPETKGQLREHKKSFLITCFHTSARLNNCSDLLVHGQYDNLLDQQKTTVAASHVCHQWTAFSGPEMKRGLSDISIRMEVKWIRQEIADFKIGLTGNS